MISADFTFISTIYLMMIEATDTVLNIVDG